MAGTDPLLLAIATMGGAVVATMLLVLVVYGLERATRPGARGAARRPASWVAGLAKTRGNLGQRLVEVWAGGGQEALWLARAEEVLLTSDVGVKATQCLVDRWRRQAGTLGSEDDLRALVGEAVRDMLSGDAGAPAAEEKPRVILVVGVNGVGKTTTIGKLAYRYVQQGKKVLLVAADTFRAAATEQLALWAKSVGADLVKHQQGGDASAVVFDGMKAAVVRGADVVIVDTAGRLHVKANLMEELKKIARTTARQVASAPHEVLLVIDATTGQNALNQARVFHEALGVDGVVLAKLDGTARGGVALAIRSELDLPIRYVGLGEGVDDLRPFDAAAFAAALFPATEMTDAA